MPFDLDPKYTETKPEAKVLRDAAAYIERHGWCQRALEDSNGNVCLLGALNAVVCGDPCGVNDNKARHKAARALLPFLDDMTWADWNNRPERTKEEVIQALLGAADMVERQ